MTSPPADEAIEDASSGRVRQKLWDLPIRIVHWGFVLLIPASWWTWQAGQMGAHRLLGYVMIALLLFRLYWGVAGSTPARFRSFVRGPRGVFSYLRGLFTRSAEPVVGHNPLGGWSVIALLTLLVAMVTLGLFAQDVDGLESGPLASYVSYELSDQARDLHELCFNLILVMIGVHLAAILFYLVVKRDNLVTPMVTGHKHMIAPAEPLRFAPAWRALLGIVLSGAIAWWISQGCPIPGVAG